MDAEFLKRRVVSTIVQEVHNRTLRLADSAQIELHSIVRERIAASGGPERVESSPESIRLRAQTLAAALRDQAEAIPSYKGRTVIRRSLLRRAVESLEPTWLIVGAGKSVPTIPEEAGRRHRLWMTEKNYSIQDQTPVEWQAVAVSGILGTALLLVVSDDDTKIEKQFLPNLTYSQGLKSVRHSKAKIAVFKWIPQSVALYDSLINQSCGVPCVDTCVEPGCSCYRGRCH